MIHVCISMFGVVKLWHFQVKFTIHLLPDSFALQRRTQKPVTCVFHFDYEISLLEHWKINKSLSENRVTKFLWIYHTCFIVFSNKIAIWGIPHGLFWIPCAKRLDVENLAGFLFGKWFTHGGGKPHRNVRGQYIYDPICENNIKVSNCFI